MSGVSRRAKAANRAALQAASETALQALRVGSRDMTFVEPPGGMPTIELAGPSLFGIDPSAYDLWDSTSYVYQGPGDATPIPRAGTKWRAVQLRGRVGVLQDSWHEAGVWPWRDGQRFIDKPWVLTMEKLHQSIWDADRWRNPPVATWAGRLELARGLIELDAIAPAEFVRLTDTLGADLAPPPRKKHRYTPPPRRLDGRR